MATPFTPAVPFGDGANSANAAVQRHWRMAPRLSSVVDAAEQFLDNSRFDRAPWLTVAFALGIACWIVLDNPWQWTAAIGASLLMALSGIAIWRDRLGGPGRVAIKTALVSLGLVFAAGVAVIWGRSEIVGATLYDYPRVELLEAYVLEREDRPAEQRIRLTLAIRDAETARARKVRVNVPIDQATSGMTEGAVLRLRARLMPPAPPMLPGSYDFSRAAWFKGLAATGSTIGQVEVVRPAAEEARLAGVQRILAAHVRGQLDGAPGTIAAAFASGDRGAISAADEDAMRDAGLTHLLSISGLHVSAVIAAAYLLALKLLALWP